MELRAMVIDDSSVMRKMVMRDLRKAGLCDFTFVEAEDGEDALDKFNAKDFDILFADWNMPNMNGIEFVRAIRRLDNAAHIPIIMVTSEKTMGKIEEALDYAGANGFISKPFNDELLYEKLKKIVDEIAQRQKKPKGFFAKLVG